MVVKTSSEESNSNSKRCKRRRGKLLKTACAGLLGAGASFADAPAQAFEFNEAASAPGGDFADSFPGTQLPAGVTSIVGSINEPPDYFRFGDLVPGSLLSLSLSTNLYNGTFQLLDSEGDLLPNDFSNPRMITVPGDGIVSGNAGSVEGGTAYSIGIEASYVVPEPASAGLAAMGAAALLGLGRRRSEESS